MNSYLGNRWTIEKPFRYFIILNGVLYTYRKKNANGVTVGHFSIAYTLTPGVLNLPSTFLGYKDQITGARFRISLITVSTIPLQAISTYFTLPNLLSSLSLLVLNFS